MAANASHRARAFGHARAGVVRTTAAKPWCAIARGGSSGRRQRALLGLQDADACLHARADVTWHTQLVEAFGNGARDDGRRQVGLGTQQPVLAGVGHGPFAARSIALLLVELAQHRGPHIGAPVVQLFLDLVLDDLALFFDHQNLLQSLGKVARDAGLQGPDHVDLVQADAELAAGGIVQTQVDQRLARVVVGFAAGDDAKAVVRAFNDVVVELVGTHIGQRGVPLVVHQARLLLQRRIGPADVQAAWRHGKVFGQDDFYAVRVDRHTAGRLHHLLDRLHARPHAREPAHGKSVQAHVQDVLHIAREKHRRAAGLEDVVTLVRCGAALADVVVPGNRNHAAVFGGAGHVGVLEDVRAAVHARALAVPDAKHTVVLFALRVQVQLLCAPHRRGAQLFVHPRLENNVIFGQVLFGSPQRLVVGTQRAAPVAADETGGVQAGGGVALALQHGQAHQRLHAAHEGAAVRQGVFVVQGDGF